MGIEIVFRTGRVQIYKKPSFKVLPLQKVIVKIDRGYDIADIVSTSVEHEPHEDFREIIRVANKRDLAKLESLRKDEEKAEKIYDKIIIKYPIEMNLFYAVQQFDDKKILFLFTSQERMDFREFARELAQIFSKRIEFVQISSRDKSKSLGGIGICGRTFCCREHLKKFHPVTVKMVREQNLTGNLSKISGPCGRLLCCIDYEKSIYQDLPNIGQKCLYNGKVMFVNANNLLDETVILQNKERKESIISLEKFKKLKFTK